MFHLLSLLVVLLFVFNESLVTARPQSIQFRAPSAPPVNISRLNTNAKRFAHGLSPLPPVIKREPTGVDTARRALNSQCSMSGLVQVITGLAEEGAYISNLHGVYSLTADRSDAAIFSSAVYSSGATDDVNLQDTISGNFLAGLIAPGVVLGSGVDDAAVLGNSLATYPGDPPQPDKDPSLSGLDSETAIWTFQAKDHSLTASWVNPAQGELPPEAIVAYLSVLADGSRFYLTDSSTPPIGAVSVTLQYLNGVGGQEICGPTA